MISTSSRPILILGSSGFLGTRLSNSLASTGYEVVRQVRSSAARPDQVSVPLLDVDSLAILLEQVQPRTIINCIANTNVDACERDILSAYKSNSETVGNLTVALRRANWDCHLIHISTDQLYDGVGPHVEERVAPLNVYALSKYAGDLSALMGGATVLRTNFVGRSQMLPTKGMSDWLFRALSSRHPITAFEDVYFSPLGIRDVCANIARVVESPHPGVFNLGSRTGCTKAEFALKFGQACGLGIDLISLGSVTTAGLAALRPLDMRMDVTKFERTFQTQLPGIDEVIESVSAEYM